MDPRDAHRRLCIGVAVFFRHLDPSLVRPAPKKMYAGTSYNMHGLHHRMRRSIGWGYMFGTVISQCYGLTWPKSILYITVQKLIGGEVHGRYLILLTRMVSHERKLTINGLCREILYRFSHYKCLVSCYLVGVAKMIGHRY